MMCGLIFETRALSNHHFLSAHFEANTKFLLKLAASRESRFLPFSPALTLNFFTMTFLKMGRHSIVSTPFEYTAILSRDKDPLQL